MNCPGCGAANPADAAFCGECGTRLPAACPQCGRPVGTPSKFCHGCGARLVPAETAPPVAPAPPPPSERFASPQTYTPRHLVDKILTSRAAIVGERKQVTVLFSDVAGFTALSEALGPEPIHVIMDRMFEVILEAVHRFEGTVNQFLGDGVMALFGAPIAHEDHADRALRAALAIQENLEPLRRDILRRHGRDFRLRLGINTGMVVVGAIGRDLRMDYTAIGDTTNLAARLMAVAEPGQIVVSRQTQHLREGFFVFDPLGTFELKGKSVPVPAWALVREIPGATRLEVSRGRGLTPMAGRAHERRTLDEALEQAAQGAGQVVLVLGEPGLGKSRLLYEFVNGLDAQGPTVLTAGCVSYGASMPFHPILEIVRSCLGLAGDASSAEVAGAVDARLAALRIDGDEPAALLKHFLGVPDDASLLTRLPPVQLREKTVALLRSLLTGRSEAAPLILIVENVHWLDASSEEVLASVAAAVRSRKIMLILTSRPQGALQWVPASAHRIALEGLRVDDLTTMVQVLVGAETVARGLLDLVVEKGAGNPLYLEEMVRQLYETGGIAVEDGEARLLASAIAVPATIHDIIAARVDRLPEALKQTLQTAAVVGREFALPLLTRVIGATVDVGGHLERLHHDDFIFPSGESPERRYTFKHALTQDVVYAGLLERHQREHHARVGGALESLHADRAEEIAELLAHHFGRSDDDDKAVDYAILAAEKAQRRWANTEALAFFESASVRLDAMDDTRVNRLRRIDAVVKQAEVKFALGRHAEHVQALERIQAIVESDADAPRRAAWHYWSGFLHSLTGASPDVSIAHCRQASAIAEAAGYDELQAFADCSLAHVCIVAGDLQGALDAGERALATFESRGNIWWACRALWALTPAANACGEWQRSFEYCSRGLRYGEQLDDLRLKVVGWLRTGVVHVLRGDPDAALRCCREAAELSPIPFDAAMIRAVEGIALVKAGQAAAGAEALEAAVTWFEGSHLRYTRAAAALWLGEAWLRQGLNMRADALFSEVLETSCSSGYRYLEGVATRLLGETLMPRALDQAAIHVARSLTICEAIGARNDVAKALVLQAQFRLGEGERATARHLFANALAIFEELGTLDEPARIREALRALALPRPPG